MMSRFSEDLRRERESRGVSLDALCAETRVNSRHLAALEQGEYGLLPGGVFRRGIARAYMVALRLDEETWMPRFQQELDRYAQTSGQTGGQISGQAGGRSVASGEQAWAEFAASVKRNRPATTAPHGMRWLLLTLLWLLLLAGLWAAWHFVLQARLRLFR